MYYYCLFSGIISIISILFSIVSLCNSLPRTVNNDNPGFDYMGIIVGVFSLLIAFLVGWQIYNSVENLNKIKDVEHSQNEIRHMIEKFNTDSESFMIKSEFMSKMAHAFALKNEQPFTSYRIMLYALVDALNTMSADLVNGVMNNLETLKNSIVRIENEGLFSIEEYSQLRVDLHLVKDMIDNQTIEGEGMFPLISKRLTEINKEVSDVIERITYNFIKAKNDSSNNQHD